MLFAFVVSLIYCIRNAENVHKGIMTLTETFCRKTKTSSPGLSLKVSVFVFVSFLICVAKIRAVGGFLLTNNFVEGTG